MALDNAVSHAESTIEAEGCVFLVCSMATADILGVCIYVSEEKTLVLYLLVARNGSVPLRN